MRFQLLAVLFQILFLVALDVIAFNGVESLFDNPKDQSIVLVIYVAIAIASYLGIIRSIKFWRSTGLERGVSTNIIMGLSLSVVVTKILFVLALVAIDVVRMMVGFGLFVAQKMNWLEPISQSIPGRPFWVVAMLAIIALFVFAAMIYGIFFGKYRFTVEKRTLEFSDLPDSFEGTRLVQISDAHSGSWDKIEGVRKGIELIQKQNPDMIVFTGDLVNQFKDEINPYIPLFQSLKAPMGKYAILGNHDYYGQPYHKPDRPAYWQEFYDKYRQMGFDLLMNENRKIEKDGSHFILAGVENWGSGRWFPKRGDLTRALEGVPDSDFVILLSHDPTHWEEKVLPHQKHIALTLSGHTHAMQFGINLPFLKWSPVSYRYKKWMGLYKEHEQLLYINRGFGYLGFPGRVGMWPEITVIELRRKRTST